MACYKALLDYALGYVAGAGACCAQVLPTRVSQEESQAKSTELFIGERSVPQGTSLDPQSSRPNREDKSVAIQKQQRPSLTYKERSKRPIPPMPQRSTSSSDRASGGNTSHHRHGTFHGLQNNCNMIRFAHG